MPIPKENLDEPFLICGYGINAYFDVLSKLSRMFLLITLFSIPLFYIYYTGRHYDRDGNPVAKTTIGNFGAATMFCKATRMGVKSMDIYCPPSTVMDKRNIQFGMMSSEFQTHIFCTREAVA